MSHRFTILLILLGALPSTAMSETSTTTTFDTPAGSITTITKTVDPTPQKIVSASRKEVMEMDELATQAKGFLATYLPGVANPSLADFDQAFHLWQREKKRRYKEAQVVKMLGAYLGNQLAADFQMEWVVVTDQDGTDYAVRAKKFEVMSFPFSSVEKRVERNQYDFMVGIYYIVKHTIETGDYKAR